MQPRPAVQCNIHGRNLEVTQRLRDYVERKLSKLGRYLPELNEIRVDLTNEQTRDADDRQVAQVTVHTKGGPLLRAEERSQDMFTAIDAVMDKIARQVKRVKGRRDRRRTQGGVLPALELGEPNGAVTENEETPLGVIVRRKRFRVEPMTEEEAVERMELLGHDFFLFYNTDMAAVNLVYRRRDGNYGLLQPDLA